MQDLRDLKSIRARVAQAYHQAHAAGQVDRVLACYAPDAVLEEVASGRAHQGHAALRAGLEKFLALFQGLVFTPGPRISAGDSLICPYVLTATVTRDLGPLKLTGQAVRLNGAHVLEFREGLIQRCRDYWDFDQLAAQAAQR